MKGLTVCQNWTIISIFGSARTSEENPHYKLGVDLAEQLSRGYGIISGGGPGIMELRIVVLKGCWPSVGLNIDLPFEQAIIHILIRS